MFNTNKKQFINILQQNKQLKIYYKTIQNRKIKQDEESSFLITDYTALPNDAQLKLNTLQRKIKATYLTSLFESPNQYIVATDSVDTIKYDSINIANKKSIIIPKNEIISTCKYFKSTGIDFILSPYTIIEEYLIDSAKKNSLNLLIYNNIIYAIIYNDKKHLSYNKIKVLTPFEATQDIGFLEDDILGQKLYEEVNFLEIQQFLIETVEDYYATNNDVEFLEHIKILYTLKPLSDTQIESLKEIMMIPIQYRAISLNNYIDEIIQAEDANLHNFITPRVKKENKSIYLWMGIVLMSIIIGIGIFNLQLDNQESMNDQSKKVQVKENIESFKVAVITLPNHSEKNKIVVQNINMLLNVVPYDSILKEIEINKNSSTFITNFIATSSSISDMQTKLRNIYADSQLLLEHKNKFIINTIIENNQLISQVNVNTKNKKATSEKHDFLSTLEATKYIEKLILKNSEITYDFKNQNKYLTYNFSIRSKINSPKDFFDFVDKINIQTRSIELSYPVIFSKINNCIEVKYKLKFNQKNQKQVQLIK